MVAQPEVNLLSGGVAEHSEDEVGGHSNPMKEHVVPYNRKLKARARELRNNMTKGEIILWQQLKDKKMMGYDFDRQRPIDQFVVDFYCKSLALAIEVDGSVHNSDEAQQYDQARQLHLEALGIRFLRFRDDEVKQSPNSVCLKIAPGSTSICVRLSMQWSPAIEGSGNEQIAHPLVVVSETIKLFKGTQASIFLCSCLTTKGMKIKQQCHGAYRLVG